MFLLLVSIAFGDPLSGADVAGLSRAKSARLSPDGSQVAFVINRSTFDAQAEPSDDDADGGWERESHIWVVAAAGGEARQVTHGKSATSPRWSANGQSLSFTRGDVLYTLPMNGGEAREFPTADHYPRNRSWLPDGSGLVFMGHEERTEAAEAARWSSGHATDWSQQWRTNRVFLAPSDEGQVSAISPEGINVVEYSLSPDGSRIAAIISPSSDPVIAMMQSSAVIIDIASAKVTRELTETPRPLEDIRWSPSGGYVSWSTADEGLSLFSKLMVMNLDSGTISNAAAALDPTLADYVWEDGDKTVLARIIERTRPVLYRLPIDGRSATLLYDERPISGNLQLRGRSLLTTTSTIGDTGGPTIIDTRKRTGRVLHDPNPQIAKWEVPNQSEFTWTNAEGVEIEGLLSTPARGSGPWALMVMPHGGPDGFSVRGWSSWVALHTSHGLAVFQPNYRGGLGYGAEHYEANRGRLGEIEFIDIESGVDALVERGIADPDRLVYGGWSWGGYLTAWTVGHTDRYIAAVAGAAVTDTLNQYALSDINHGEVARWEFKALPWEDFDAFDAHSPVRHLSNAKTPTLIIHGRRDNRVPFGQGLTLFRALEEQGVPTKFLAYPGESHGFRQPAHVAHMLDQWTAWYQQHLEDEE